MCVAFLSFCLSFSHARLGQDLEFASVIVQKLNVILITSPELADFRKRLKSLETRVRVQRIAFSSLLMAFDPSARRSSVVYDAV